MTPDPRWHAPPDEHDLSQALTDLNWFVRSPIALFGIHGNAHLPSYHATRQAGSTLSCLLQQLRDEWRAERGLPPKSAVQEGGTT
jgi:hypothetical protein